MSLSWYVIWIVLIGYALGVIFPGPGQMVRAKIGL